MYNSVMPVERKISPDGLSEFEVHPENFPGKKEKQAKEQGESAPDQTAEKSEQGIEPVAGWEAVKEGLGQEGSAVATPSVVARTAKQLPHYQAVEKILEADLGEVYRELPPDKQREFKIKGEVTAVQIARLLDSSKIKLTQLSQKIFALLINWLKIIPGLNRFFLEQEAKIKADKILTLKNKK